MKPKIFVEAVKIWDKISVGEKLKDLKMELEIHKKLLNFFQVGDYYYWILDLKESRWDLMSEEVETVLGYKREDLDIGSFVNKIHPEDQPWFLNIEIKVVEFFSKLTLEQIPNYKVRYDYRVRKSDGEYIRILHQVITIQHSESGGVLKTFGLHTDISHLKMDGIPVLSFIGQNGEPSFVNVDIKKVFPTPTTFLTSREQQILFLLVNGKITKEIASELFISEETVSTHRKNLLSKTKAKNTSEMISMAIRKGWV
jgi:DNA-binding CsgD family transcriptional regulator